MSGQSDFELELKLEAEAGDLDRLAGSDPLRAAPFSEREQVSTYFDTPARELRAAGLSLRVRATGARHVQTVKAESRAAAGLFARAEWECEVAGERPVLDDRASILATLFDEAALAAVAPVFVARVTRREALIEHDGGLVELVLDRGEIAAGDRSAPVSEIELELKRGSPAALFSLAHLLARDVPVRLGVLTKSERGYRLLATNPDKAVKGEAGVLAGDMTAAAAFQAIASSCLRQFRLNETILLRTQAAEALHQARVALRRLRSALSIFKPVVADERFEPLREELRWLSALLGDARNVDVLLKRFPAEDRLLAAREETYAAALAALDAERGRLLMLDLLEWTTVGRWRADPADAALPGEPADRFAAAALDHLRRRVKRRGRDLASLTDEERHEVRIDAKKLRYASEFFAGLFTGKKAVRRAGRFLTALEELQERLGELNDLATAPLLLAQLGLPEPRVQKSDRAELIGQAADAHEAFADAKPFWR